MTQIPAEEPELIQIQMSPQLKRWLREVAHHRRQRGLGGLDTMSAIVVDAIGRLMFAGSLTATRGAMPLEAAISAFTTLVEEVSRVTPLLPQDIYSIYSGHRTPGLGNGRSDSEAEKDVDTAPQH